MKRKVRKNQWINNVIYNGVSLMLIEKDCKFQKHEAIPETTVFICNEHYLKVGEFCDEDYVGRCVLWHEPRMYWENYDKYFDLSKVRVITCYPKVNGSDANVSSLNSVARELAQYIVGKHIKGKILLIGHSKAGLIMYAVGSKIQHDDGRKITVMTVSAPFAGTDMASKETFQKCRKERFPAIMSFVHKRLCCEHNGNLDIVPKSKFLEELPPLPDDVNHVAFISSIDTDERARRTFEDRVLERVDKWCNVRGDGVVSLQSQSKWPEKRDPNLCLVVATTHASSLRLVLKDFGKYAEDEVFFSRIDELRDERGIEEVFGNIFF